MTVSRCGPLAPDLAAAEAVPTTAAEVLEAAASASSVAEAATESACEPLLQAAVLAAAAAPGFANAAVAAPAAAAAAASARCLVEIQRILAASSIAAPRVPAHLEPADLPTSAHAPAELADPAVLL